MRKMLLKEIKNAVVLGVAENITAHGLDDYKELKKVEGVLENVGYSVGTYGLSGLLIRGLNSGNLYAITKRSTALFIYY